MHSGLYRRLAASTLKKNARTYLPYLLSACGTVAVFYILAYLALNSGSGTTGMVMICSAIPCRKRFTIWPSQFMSKI